MSERITATNWRNCVTRLLTVDGTVRSIVLSPGRYLLFGDATQIVRFAVRRATDSLGTLDTGEVAPASLPAPTAGTPAAGAAFDNAGATTGSAEIQPDATAYRHIDVPEQSKYFLVLYLSATAAATPKLLGPVHWDLIGGNHEAH
jgi:hypothetical protein